MERGRQRQNTVKAAADGTQPGAVCQPLGAHGHGDVHADAAGADQHPGGHEAAAFCEQLRVRQAVGAREQADHVAEQQRIEELQGGDAQIAGHQHGDRAAVLREQPENPAVNLDERHEDDTFGQTAGPFARRIQR